mgnify:CR=1 FL=1
MDETTREEQGAAARKVTLVGMVVNAVNAAVKILVGSVANSYALIADGIHSLSDLLSDVLVLAASHFGRKQADKDHPYGHDRYETLATLLLGALLIAVAGALIWDSLTRLLTPREMVPPGAIALLVALASIVSKEWIYRYTLRIARSIQSKLLEGNAWHHRTDSLSSVVVFIAVGGALLGYPWLDQIAATIVALMVAKVGFSLIWDSLKELVDTALPQEDIVAIRECACAVAGVTDVHDLRSRSMAGRTLIDIHLQVDPHISVSEGHAVGVWVAHRLRETFPHISDVIFHIDPEDDVDDKIPDPQRMLPLRRQALKSLHQRWAGEPTFEKPHQTVLHYLDQGIDVDLFYSAEQLSLDQLEGLQVSLAGRALDLPWLRRVRVWIGTAE